MTTASPQIHTGDLREKLARADCAFFASEYLGCETGEHHLEWSRLWSTCRRVDILAARGHGKSGFWSYAIPSWESWRIAKNRGLVISDTEDQVGELFRIFKDGVQFTDELGHVWKLPALVDTELAHLVPKNFERSWTGSQITFKNGSRFAGKTFGKRFRGRHVPWIIVDDPHGDEASYSELARLKDYDFLMRSVLPMLLTGGRVAVVGTPLHGDDIHGKLRRNDEWTCREYPAIQVDPETGAESVLWPAFRPRAYLESQRRAMGTLAFNQEYLLRPAANEATLFPLALFTSRPETLASHLRLRPTAAEMSIRTGWTYFAGVDLALSSSAEADHTVITVLGVDAERNRHIVEIVRTKGLPYIAQHQLIVDTLARYHTIGRLAAVVVESNQAQRIFGDELIRKTDLPIVKFTTSAQEKHDLVKGVPALRTLLENGKLRIARGDPHSIETTDMLIAELQAFAWLKGKLQGIGSHDDMVMSLWLADVGVRGSQALTWFTVDGIDAEAEPRERVARDDVPKPPPAPPPGLAVWPATEAAKQAMIRQGYVPETCTLPVDVAAPLIFAETSAGRSPCWGCHADRSVCRGQPYRGGVELRRPERGDPEPAQEPARISADMLAACAGDIELARQIPPDRLSWIEAWNAMMGAGASPVWAAVILAGGTDREEALYAALRRLLGLGGESSPADN